MGKGKYFPSSKGKLVDELSHDMAGVRIDHEEEGEWVVISKKSRNRAGKPPGPRNTEDLQKQGWGTNGGSGRTSGNNLPQANDPRRPAGRGNSKPQPSNRNRESAYRAPPAVTRPPLHNGWEWGKTNVSFIFQAKPEEDQVKYEGSTGRCDSDDSSEVPQQPDDGSDDYDMVGGSDDALSDDYDSDVSQKSHESRKKRTWFKRFFESLDRLSVGEINEQTRQWHCPACQNGPGAVDWYNGLQPLMTHAKTKGTTRVKLHRELAALLDEELCRRGTSVIPASEVFGKWKGLRETTADHEIVWPPMVMIMNTRLDRDENDKWIGMGNQELVDYFSTYAAKRARHSYGPNGHRGISVLLFEADAMGYLEAERLHKHFAEEGRDRDAWERHQVLFYPGGKRMLYGYLARKEDMDIFNRHCQGKSGLKFEMKSYQEMVVSRMKQMSEDNHQLIWLKNKVVQEQERSKQLEGTFGVLSKKLQETNEEKRILRLRTKLQHEENKEEMDNIELFFKEQIDKVQKSTEEKERNYERVLQEQRAKAKQFELSSGTKKDNRIREEETARFIDSQVKGVKEFESARDRLIQAHEEKNRELKHRYLAEKVELEEAFEAAVTELMKMFAPNTFLPPAPPE